RHGAGLPRRGRPWWAHPAAARRRRLGRRRRLAHRRGPAVEGRGVVSRVRAQAGYSLVEVVVAFALLALALTILLGTMSGATRQLRRSDAAGRGALRARAPPAGPGGDGPAGPRRGGGRAEER